MHIRRTHPCAASAPALAMAMLLSGAAWAAEPCPAPEELSKLCPGEKLFQDKPVVENNALQCVYNYALTSFGGGPKLPQAWLKVSADPKNRATAKEVAEADAKEITARGAKMKMTAAAEKAPWAGVEAWVINSTMSSTKVPGDLYYVKTKAGVRTVHLKANNQVPACAEQVVRWVAAH